QRQTPDQRRQQTAITPLPWMNQYRRYQANAAQDRRQIARQAGKKKPFPDIKRKMRLLAIGDKAAKLKRQNKDHGAKIKPQKKPR
ncbi:MAG TPA: hypothetical protein PKY10_07490, partial [Lentisphaeria bacterium]|nr:hypothetical protein [Lentisphaeria bacterium]